MSDDHFYQTPSTLLAKRNRDLQKGWNQTDVPGGKQDYDGDAHVITARGHKHTPSIRKHDRRFDYKS